MGALNHLEKQILSSLGMMDLAASGVVPVLQRVMNARQFGLKLIANVTYGYTSAGFSGRMPMAEIADSIVQVSSTLNFTSHAVGAVTLIAHSIPVGQAAHTAGLHHFAIVKLWMTALNLISIFSRQSIVGGCNRESLRTTHSAAVPSSGKAELPGIECLF